MEDVSTYAGSAQYKASYIAAVPNIFSTRDRLHGSQFFHGLGMGEACNLDPSYVQFMVGYGLL